MEVTGEILHGKTSPLQHDSKGVYHGLAQDLPVTRYHSLAGTHPTLPDCLEVSSWIASGPGGGKGTIMGVRHKTFLVEGVQFHPESILTAEGRPMLRNFLKMKGGTWAENERRDEGRKDGQSAAINGSAIVNGVSLKKDDGEQKESILEKIYKHRRTVVEKQKLEPSETPSILQADYGNGFAPKQISFPDRLRKSPYPLSLMAEIKRASPSKGVIADSAHAPSQAIIYAAAGASVISVLTEPNWFRGSLRDLSTVRQSLDRMPNRPAVLQKDFIFDEYQILEARLAGADTVLLIVKMLDWETLQRLYRYSQSLGMEPLVEVNTEDEMKIATALGAQVIGVNNRNLVNFEVDLETTSRMMKGILPQTIVCALSGISGPNDVAPYQKNGVGAVLVGEALMRASDTAMFIREMLGRSEARPKGHEIDVLVKICGTRTPEAAKAAIEGGADLIGVILVQGRRRCVSESAARAISQVIRNTKKPSAAKHSDIVSEDEPVEVDYYAHTSTFFRRSDRALLVGVFQNQPLSYIVEQQKLLELDIVQLHGDEPIEWASLIPVPVIKRFAPHDPAMSQRGYHSMPLLDSASGGTGYKLDVEVVKKTLMSDPGLKVFLAGGLDPENVADVLQQLSEYRSRLLAVDVSSGVEEDGAQDLDKIRRFIKAAKSVH